MLEHSDGMIHMPFIPPYTLSDKYDSEDLEKLSDSLKQEEEKILQLYVDNTTSEKELLRKYMDEETQLSADDMVKLGFATEVQQPLKAVAFFNINHKKDEKMSKELEEKADGILAKFENFINKFSRLSPENMVIADATGKEITVERKEGDIKVGDKASPNGTFTLKDGKIVTIAEGAISKIDEDEEEDEEKEKLQKENAELKKKLAAHEAKSLEIEEKAKNIEEKEKVLADTEKEAVNLVEELKSWKSEVVVSGRANNFTKTTDKVSKFDAKRTLERLETLNKED